MKIYLEYKKLETKQVQSKGVLKRYGGLRCVENVRSFYNEESS